VRVGPSDHPPLYLVKIQEEDQERRPLQRRRTRRRPRPRSKTKNKNKKNNKTKKEHQDDIDVMTRLNIFFGSLADQVLDKFRSGANGQTVKPRTEKE